MNKVFLIFRYDEQGDKDYLKHDDGSLVCVSVFSDVGEIVFKRGGGFDNGWEVEIFYNPVQE